jgi:hypothetical protein
MRTCALTCAAAIAAFPASAQDLGLVIDLLPGHPVYHAAEREAGVVMAVSITPEHGSATDLQALCEELRVAAGLAHAHGEGLPLEVIFVVPYKDMAIEGYYLPADGASGTEVLVAGNAVTEQTLEGIVARAGVPGPVLAERDVEHEVACELGQPAWLLRWEDVRLIGDEEPDAVIDRAWRRFTAIHQSIVAHATALRPAQSQSLVAKRLARRSSP